MQDRVGRGRCGWIQAQESYLNYNLHHRRDLMEKLRQTISNLNSLSISCTNLDFGPQFAEDKEAGEYVASVNKYLQFHENNKINRFHLLFTPLEIFASDIENWIAFAVNKGVKDLILDFSKGFDNDSGEFLNGGKPFKLPPFIFACKTLTSLTLSHWIFDPPQVFDGFNHLRSLEISHVKISNDKLQMIISNFPSLETLFIRFCTNLESFKVSSQSLQKLVIVDCFELYHFEINTPQLQSFIYYGEHIFGDTVMQPKNPFINISSLTEACISSIGMESTEPEHDYIKLLFELKQVKVLTVCTATLLNVTIIGDEFSHENLPVILENLKELQLLMDIMNDEYLSYIHGFFHHCPPPYLERLFILLPVCEEQVPSHDRSEIMEVCSDVAFKHLKAIKIVNFKGFGSEMRLVRFLLERALVLETMMIVAPPKDRQDKHGFSIGEKNLYEQISLLPKASLVATIILFGSLNDGSSLTPTHTEYYHEL